MESNAALKSRLTREGRWGEAANRYAAIVEELVASGTRKTAAKAKAWPILQAEFPPLLSARETERIAAMKAKDRAAEKRLAAAEPLSDDDTLDETDEPANPDEAPSGLPVGNGSFDEDLRWAYDHLGASVTIADAPSGPAWFLREHGRAAKTRGAFVTMAQKALSKKSSDDGAKMRDDRARQFGLLASLSREFAGISQ